MNMPNFKKYKKIIFPILTFVGTLGVMYGVIPEGVMTEELKLAIVGGATAIINIVVPEDEPSEKMKQSVIEKNEREKRESQVDRAIQDANKKS